MLLLQSPHNLLVQATRSEAVPSHHLAGMSRGGGGECAVMAFAEAGDHWHLQHSLIPLLGLISVSGCEILWYPA